MTFDKLDLNLFVAGELEIITDVRTKDKEKDGRLNLLKKIMYLSTSYDFNTLKSYYAAVLREIELGKKSWSDDFQYIEAAILSKHVPKNKSSFHPRKSFSAKYQRIKMRLMILKRSYGFVHSTKETNVTVRVVIFWLLNVKPGMPSIFVLLAG